MQEELTPEDQEKVQTIMGMGIPQDQAIQAYLMCGRDVQMAIQFYFGEYPCVLRETYFSF